MRNIRFGFVFMFAVLVSVLAAQGASAQELTSTVTHNINSPDGSVTVLGPNATLTSICTSDNGAYAGEWTATAPVASVTLPYQVVQSIPSDSTCNFQLVPDVAGANGMWGWGPFPYPGVQNITITYPVVLNPTPVPTEVPTEIPTAVPTEVPTEVPTAVPTDVPADDDMDRTFATTTFSVFACDNVTEVQLVSSTADVTRASFVTDEANDICDATTADITIVNGATGETITVPNSTVVDVAVGDWEVYVNGTYAGVITVLDGAQTDVVIQIPSGNPYREGQALHISKFYCENIGSVIYWTDPTLGVVPPDPATDAVPAESECAPGTATFTFYLVGDGTADYDQVIISGAGSVELPAGDWVVVEEETGAQIPVTLEPGVNSFLVVLNPATADSPIIAPGNLEDGDVPGLDVPPVATEVPATEAPAAPATEVPAASSTTTTSTSTSSTSAVAKLPSTGQAAADGVGVLVIAASAAAAVAGAGALTLRKRQ